ISRSRLAARPTPPAQSDNAIRKIWTQTTQPKASSPQWKFKLTQGDFPRKSLETIGPPCKMTNFCAILLWLSFSSTRQLSNTLLTRPNRPTHSGDIDRTQPDPSL